MNTYFGYLKIFECEEYADQFLAGNIFCNPLKFFKQREIGDDGRGDPLEGAIGILQPHELKAITISAPGTDLPPLKLNQNSLAGPVIFHRDADLLQRVFCMYAFHFQKDELEFTMDDVDSDIRLQSVKNRFQVDERCYQLGSHAVYIHNGQKFLEALGAFSDKTGQKIQYGLVRYYDDSAITGRFAEGNVAFRKSNRFAYQREFRLAFEASGTAPVTLDVGDLRSYAIKLPSHQLRDLEVNVEFYDDPA
ncbi:hypothetical protein HGO37_26005 [Rhizobium sp. CG4]|uniref:hypothetical protein n=1 Tax=Rhizobium sp. CG4 TaxID=2726075 RepID=UPI0020347D28|nr:hypothetical protein [Rhizobium sp. CG4]MCM2458841.1 hypothetical protein [Rhizobium sp. CG4]